MENMEFAKFLMERIGRSIPSSTEPPSEYKCEKCHDSGWIICEEDGYRYSRKCSCRLAREAEEMLRNSGLADTVSQQTFDAFKTDTIAQSMVKGMAEKYLETLLTDWGKPRMPWLYIGGNPGSGKTHICTAVCGQLLRHNIGVKYMQWLNESRKLKAGVNDENFEDAVSEYIGVPVLYIDDLLKQKYVEEPKFSEADIKIAFTILNARYIMNKPTIISSEWDLIDQLLTADEGLFSRIYERSKGFTINISRKRENNYRLNGG